MGPNGSTLLVLLVTSIAQASEYAGPQKGELEKQPDYHFTFSSDWAGDQISNRITNDHDKHRLLYRWLHAGLLRASNNLLPPGKSDSNKYSCPKKNLSLMKQATINYGLRGDAQPAPTYTLAAEEPPEKLVSSIKLETEEEPVELKVESTYNGRVASYRFQMNRQLVLALPSNLDRGETFAAKHWRVDKEAMDEFATMFSEEEAEGFKTTFTKAYFAVQPGKLDAEVEVAGEALRAWPVMVFLGDTRGPIGSGVIMLHTTKPVE